MSLPLKTTREDLFTFLASLHTGQKRVFFTTKEKDHITVKFYFLIDSLIQGENFLMFSFKFFHEKVKAIWVNNKGLPEDFDEQLLLYFRSDMVKAYKLVLSNKIEELVANMFLNKINKNITDLFEKNEIYKIAANSEAFYFIDIIREIDKKNITFKTLIDLYDFLNKNYLFKILYILEHCVDDRSWFSKRPFIIEEPREKKIRFFNLN